MAPLVFLCLWIELDQSALWVCYELRVLQTPAVESVEGGCLWKLVIDVLWK